MLTIKYSYAHLRFNHMLLSLVVLSFVLSSMVYADVLPGSGNHLITDHHSIRESTKPADTGLASLPAAAQATVSAVAGRDNRSYHAVVQGKDFHAENPRHALRVDFTSDGVQVRTGTSRWGLKLSGYGYGERLSTVSASAPLATANRVEYLHGAVKEWYINGPMGLEQGFTLSGAPKAHHKGPLTLGLALTGDLSASVGVQGDELTLKQGNGMASMRYSGLTAYDSTGRQLRAWLQIKEGQLLVRINEAGAQYPIIVDPFVQNAKLIASDGAAGDEFGSAVAISGDTVVVGSAATIGVNEGQGAAYVFMKPASGWWGGGGQFTEVAKLTASDGAAGDDFGSAVGISGDTVVVGANGVNSDQGAAYIFVKPASGWGGQLTETAKLTASDGAGNDDFGWDVAISGDTVVVGAQQHFSNGHGAAYIFVKPSVGWGGQLIETAKLTASNGVDGDSFGDTVSISGDTVVVGADMAKKYTNIDFGAEYVFVKPGSGWGGQLTETAKLTLSSSEKVHWLTTVAISGDTVVVGAEYIYINGQLSVSGAVYVFVKPASGWEGQLIETAKLSSPDAEGYFGQSVAISSDNVVVGDPKADDGGIWRNGKVYLFVKPASGWGGYLTETAQLLAPDPASDENDFGCAVAISGDTAIGGERHAHIGVNKSQGAAYVFELLFSCTGQPDGRSCVDNNRCTINGVCTNGTCAGTPKPIDDGNPCTSDVCDPVTGNISHTPVADGTTCDDNNLCTENDVCTNGTCAGTPKPIDDGNPCTSDVCDPVTGNITHTPIVLTVSGIIDTIAGNGTAGYSGDNGPATSASINVPYGSVAVDSSGNIYIADTYNSRIRKVDTGGIITTVAGNGTSGYSGDNGPATSASINYPYGVAVDSSGNIYIADSYNSRIRKVNTGGTITTVAGNGTSGYSGDNGPATSASINVPYGVAVDSSGNIYIADSSNALIRKVDTSGTITTVAGNNIWGYSGDNGPATSASINVPYGVAVDSSGNIFIADTFNSRIRKVDTGGTITTVAGNGTYGYSGDNGPATSANLSNPTGVAVDTSGNIYIADTDNSRIRKVDTGGTITTVAGNGVPVYSGDNGSATSASIIAPTGVTVDSSVNIYISDGDSHRIRKVTRPMSCLCQPDGTPCNDGKPCTINDVCTNGVCAGTPKPIDHGNPCTTDVCDPVTGNVTHTPVADGTSCADADHCNGEETCKAGVCTAGTAVVCAPPAACQATGVCQPTTGKCTYANLADGTACNDSVFCNGTDACSNGTCSVHSGNPCKAGRICNETTDHCDSIVVTDCTGYRAGTACDDKNACTRNDKCVKVLTKMVCMGTPVANGISCDDGNLCTTGDACYFGFCLGKPKVCNDNNPCTLDSCDPATGSCKYVAKPNGTACEDGNLCTASDTCQSGTCTAGTARVCDDHNPCTTDTCDPAKGCVYTPIPGCKKADVGIYSFTVPSPVRQGTTATIKIQTKNYGPLSTTGSITLYKDGAAETTWKNLSFPNGQITTQSYRFNPSGLAGKTIKWYAAVTVDDTDPIPSNNTSAVKSMVVTK